MCTCAEDVDGGVGRAVGRRRRSNNRALDPELMDAFEGAVSSLTIINGLAKEDASHSSSQSN